LGHGNTKPYTKPGVVKSKWNMHNKVWNLNMVVLCTGSRVLAYLAGAEVMGFSQTEVNMHA
jgi:hypothetical protein